MNNASSEDSRSAVHDLIRQREQLRGWLAKLDDVATSAPGRVTERVRADYQLRLSRVNEDLGGHRDELEGSLEGLRDSLREAEGRREHALEALEETRLRHMIGELTDAQWEEGRPELENEVAAAEEEVGRTRDEVERLSRLVHEITGGSGAEEAAAPAAPEAPSAAAEEPAPETPPATPEAEAEPGVTVTEVEARVELTSDPFGDEFPAETAGASAATPAAGEEDLPWLDSLGRQPAWEEQGAGDDGLDFLNDIPETRAGAAPAEDGLAEDDLAFLEELDRAISGGTTPAAPASPPSGAVPPPAAPAAGAVPAGRLICKECGAPNEPHSWYCEVCGSEL